MIKKNFLQQPLAHVQAHGGNGKIYFSRVFEKNEFVANWDFIDYAVIPPGQSIGEHVHGNNEELYIILEGTGMMQGENGEFRVTPGDLVLNAPMGRHGLYNDSPEDLRILVVEIPVGT